MASVSPETRQLIETELRQLYAYIEAMAMGAFLTYPPPPYLRPEPDTVNRGNGDWPATVASANRVVDRLDHEHFTIKEAIPTENEDPVGFVCAVADFALKNALEAHHARA